MYGQIHIKILLNLNFLFLLVNLGKHKTICKTHMEEKLAYTDFVLMY